MINFLIFITFILFIIIMGEDGCAVVAAARARVAGPGWTGCAVVATPPQADLEPPPRGGG